MNVLGPGHPKSRGSPVAVRLDRLVRRRHGRRRRRRDAPPQGRRAPSPRSRPSGSSSRPTATSRSSPPWPRPTSRPGSDRGERARGGILPGDASPRLRDDRERVVSLVYEEFCLLEERGERPEPEAFCDRYEPWRDSLLVAAPLARRCSARSIGGLARARRLPCAGRPVPHVPPRRDPRRGGLGPGLPRQRRVARRPQGGAEGLDRPGQGAGHPGPAGPRPHRPGAVGDRRPRDRAPRPVHALPRRPAAGRGDPPGRPREPPARCRHPAGRSWKAGPRRTRPRASAPRAGRASPTAGPTPQGVAWIVAVIARALAYAHGRGVYHRDVKPANVLLTRREGPQLLDFNLSHDPHDGRPRRGRAPGRHPPLHGPRAARRLPRSRRPGATSASRPTSTRWACSCASC